MPFKAFAWISSVKPAMRDEFLCGACTLGDLRANLGKSEYQFLKSVKWDQQ